MVAISERQTGGVSALSPKQNTLSIASRNNESQDPKKLNLTDEFINPENTQRTSQSQPSFFTRFIQGIVNFGRELFKIVRAPFYHALNYVQDWRNGSHLQAVANERGSDEQSLRAFHSSHEFNPSNPDNERALFRYYRSNSNKTAVILVLGNAQGFQDDSGINRLAQELNRQGHPVLVLNPGDVARGLPFRFGVGSDPWHTPRFRYSCNAEIMNDFRGRRGIFSDLQSSDCVVGGYSLGGGTVVGYTNESNSQAGNLLPMRAAAVIDGVGDPRDLGVAETGRPNVNGPVINICQNNSYCINGQPHTNQRPGDVTLCFNDETHDSIDERAVAPICKFFSRIFRQNIVAQSARQVNK